MTSVNEAERPTFLHSGHQIDERRRISGVAIPHRKREGRIHLVPDRLPHPRISRVQLRSRGLNRDAFRSRPDLQFQGQFHRRKRVHHYLMRPTGGDTANHDHEYDEVRWFPVSEAERRLTFPDEVEMLRKAVALLSERAEGES